MFPVKQDPLKHTYKWTSILHTLILRYTTCENCQVGNIFTNVSLATLHISSPTSHLLCTNEQVYLTWACHNFDPMDEHLDTQLESVYICMQSSLGQYSTYFYSEEALWKMPKSC